MARIEPVRREYFEDQPPRRGPQPAPRAGYIRTGRPHVQPDTPSHTPGTNRAEEWIFKAEEKGRHGTARTARSSTSIDPKTKGPIDPRMPHLPPA